MYSLNTTRTFFIPGVILQSYGAGNVPSNYQGLIDLFKEATEKHNIVLLNITQCWTGSVSGVYATGAILNTVGAISGCVSSSLLQSKSIRYVRHIIHGVSVCAFCKLLFVFKLRDCSKPILTRVNVGVLTMSNQYYPTITVILPLNTLSCISVDWGGNKSETTTRLRFHSKQFYTCSW